MSAVSAYVSVYHHMCAVPSEAGRCQIPLGLKLLVVVSCLW